MDGQAGFPAEVIGEKDSPITLRVKDDTLRIRSPRTAHRYLGRDSARIMDEAGFVDTGDVVALQGRRYFFVGRRDGTINIGGLKVHPEEVEAVINSHPSVQMSLVMARKSPILGSVVAADLVLRNDEAGLLTNNCAAAERIKHEVMENCRNALPRHKVPAVMRVVPSLRVLASGKLARAHA
ncbi:MAG: AMP-binding enzyme [Acetobacteraceae bacterium]